MDRSVGRLPDPVTEAPNRERRRCVRQKLHTPVYASFNGSQTGMTVDLSELLDLNEEGFAVQTSERLEANHAVTICLDLPETRSFIHGSGQVVWSDETGRGGIRFSPLSDSSRKVLKEWLFANLLIACSNHQARSAQRARHAEEKLSLPEPNAEPTNLVRFFDRTERLSPLEAVRREVRELGDNVDEVFHLIADRALSLTGASGVALAFLSDDNMVCRARAGEPAPPLGAPVDVKRGLSGECVRSGLLVSCENMETDPRVDPEVGRALGIGSLMASPIVSDFRVVGLLEVFSPYPHSFTQATGTVLERLGEMIPKVPGTRSRSEIMPVESLSENGRTEGLTPSAPAAAESTASELFSLHATREALWDDEPGFANSPFTKLGVGQHGVSETVNPQASSWAASNRVPEPLPEVTPEAAPEPTPEPAPETAPRLLYRALLGLVIAVVAIAVGYVLAPVIEKSFAGLVLSSQRSSPGGVDAGSSVTGQNAAQGSSGDTHGQVKSVAELQKFADQGDADSQWQMAVRYHNGEGVPQDDTQAMKWFERAAEQGHIDAQSRLGAYYWAGRGVPEDLSKAYFWSAIATAQGDEISKSRLEGLTYQMTHAQITDARQQAEIWLHNHSQRARTEAN